MFFFRERKEFPRSIIGFFPRPQMKARTRGIGCVPSLTSVSGVVRRPSPSEKSAALVLTFLTDENGRNTHFYISSEFLSIYSLGFYSRLSRGQASFPLGGEMETPIFQGAPISVMDRIKKRPRKLFTSVFREIRAKTGKA